MGLCWSASKFFASHHGTNSELSEFIPPFRKITMRFFKTFNLLHRRTKSDVFVSGSPLEPAITNSGRRSSVPVSLFDLAVSQIPANFKHLDGNGSGNGVSVAVPIFGLESELNARLREANSRWANDYANLQCQLQECRKELHSERRKVQCLQRKLEEDNRIILDLRMSSRRLEGLLGVSSYATDSESQQDAISGQIGMLQNVSTLPNFVKGSFTNVMNIRTMDEYSSALRMTLATRKELRDQRKVSLYWKRKALDSNQLQSTITPSVSTISSIHDPLPVDRQIALDALISRRSLNSTLGSQMGSKDTSPKIVIPKQSPTYQPADKVGSPIAIARPVTSFANSSSCLGPLASESIKAEISSLFGSPDRVKHLTPRTRREQNHSSSLVGRLIKFTFATSTPAKKTDLTLNVESFGDLHAFFAVRHHYLD